jgi:hypothetical protein
MPRGVATAKQLAMMARVLNAYSGTYNVADPVDREEVAGLILELFNLGFREEEPLLAELIRRRA